jgi:ribosomal protein L11 methyltransferase
LKAFRITVPGPDEDLATALLFEEGTQGIEVQADDSGRASLLAYFPDEVGALALHTALLRIPGAKVESAAVPAVDWVSRFRESFRSFRAGRFLIAPSWENPSGTDAGVLVIEPGRAFGTGTHESTRLCLAALSTLAEERPLGRVLDVGTGTGLLAVAAAKLGAHAVVGVDNDPDSLEAARLHARLNQVPLRTVRADGGRSFLPGRFDVVLANLTAPLLIERHAELGALVAGGGALVLSGMLASDLAEVRAAHHGIGAVSVTLDGEWAALLYRRGRP